ncbi:unnamed protein product [Taenia asiatica]|uniref:Protein kinase domain-containing protein n=1 Tax=Taenia asiatica TaxID=60517 RepID=A0A158R979_TAEAS|nr:unnamed protein product [Taenia asiatica]
MSINNGVPRTKWVNRCTHLLFSRYEKLSKIGEGAYGMVFKCLDTQTGDMVAVKRFNASDDDPLVKKIALREIKMLKCIHRDIKPENILINAQGEVKLCDFGFARFIADAGDAYTDYVATRWYRSPELLVGDKHYGPPVDIWAVGCVFAEMLTRLPLWPGRSDLDQIYLITKNLVKSSRRLLRRLNLPQDKAEDDMNQNGSTEGLPPINFKVLLRKEPLEVKFEGMRPKITPAELEVLKSCLVMDPNGRSTCSALLQLLYFEKIRNPDASAKVPSLQIDASDEVTAQRPLSNEVTTASVIYLDGLSLQNASGKGRRTEKPTGQVVVSQSTLAESHGQNASTHHTFVRADQRKLAGSMCSLANKGTAMKLQPVAFPWLSGSCTQLNRRSGGDPNRTPSPNTATAGLRSDLQATQPLTRFQGLTATNVTMPIRGGHLTPAWPIAHRTPSAGPKH